MKSFLLCALINILIVVNVSCEFTSWRLPNTTIPIDYNISVTVISRKPYEILEAFSGAVGIKVKVTEVIADLYLHSKFANISEVFLTDIDHQNIPVAFKSIPDRELVHISPLSGNLIANSEYIIKIAYISKLRRDKLGFHLSSYVNSAGQKVYVCVMLLHLKFIFVLVFQRYSFDSVRSDRSTACFSML